VFTQWTARWKYRKMNRPVVPGGGSFSTILRPLGDELATPYKKNWSDVDVPGYLHQGSTPFDNPIVDAINTLHLTKHLVLQHNENDGHTYAVNCQRDIRSLIETAIGIGGVDWWSYEFDGVLEAPHFGDRFTNTVYASDASAAAAGVARSAVVLSRPDDTPDDSEKIYNQIDLQGGAVLDLFGYPVPLVSSRSIAGGTFGTTALGVLPAPPFSDPSILDQATLDKRGDSLLGRHQIMEQAMTLRLLMDASAGDGFAEGMIRPGNKLQIREDDGGFTGPYYVVDWDIEEWIDPTKTIQVVQVASTFGDYHGNASSPAAQGLFAGQFATLGQSGTGGGGGSCCGGEMLMAEATTQTQSPPYVSVSGDVQLLDIPITVDTTNTRIRVVGHFWISGAGSGSPALALVGPDGTTRSVPADSSGAWHAYTVEVPALNVIAEGSYNVTASISGVAGATLVGYQVLVYLVTSG
jgi:hypothetical protein